MARRTNGEDHAWFHHSGLFIVEMEDERRCVEDLANAVPSELGEDVQSEAVSESST